MKHRVALVLLFVAMGAQTALAQQNLTPQQLHGRQILTQNCVVCHLPSDPGREDLRTAAEQSGREWRSETDAPGH